MSEAKPPTIVAFKLRDHIAQLPSKWVNTIPSWDRESPDIGAWVARLDYNAKGEAVPLGSGIDASPGAKIKLGLGHPIVRWGPYVGIDPRRWRFDASGLQVGQALAFGITASSSGARLRRYGVVIAIEADRFELQATKGTVEAVKLSEQIKKLGGNGTAQMIVPFGPDAPLVRQLETLAAIYDMGTICVALDWMQDRGLGREPLPEVPHGWKEPYPQQAPPAGPLYSDTQRRAVTAQIVQQRHALLGACAEAVALLEQARERAAGGHFNQHGLRDMALKSLRRALQGEWP